MVREIATNDATDKGAIASQTLLCGGHLAVVLEVLDLTGTN